MQIFGNYASNTTIKIAASVILGVILLAVYSSASKRLMELPYIYRDIKTPPEKKGKAEYVIEFIVALWGILFDFIFLGGSIYLYVWVLKKVM